MKKGLGIKHALWCCLAFLLLACSGSKQSVPGTPGNGTAPETLFGVEGGFPNFAAEISNAGIRIVRLRINWSEIEPVNNQYNWAAYDQIIDSARQAGIEILGDLIDTPAWAQASPDYTGDAGEILDMNEFREFAYNVAARYKGKLKYIEILNEVTLQMFFEQVPGNRYEDWIIAGYQAVKAGNPDAQVAIGGFVNPLDVPTFVDKMLENYSAYYDIVNFHIYATDDQVTAATRFIKERMQAYGVSKPLWITETATKTFDTEVDRERMAIDVIKRFSRAFGEGVQAVFWWQLVDTPLPSEWSGDGTAMWVTALGWDYPKSAGLPQQFHPRQAYFTYKLMTSKLTGFSSVTQIIDTQYKFIVNGKAVYVLWGAGNVPSEITGMVKVTDYLGRETVEEAGSIVLNTSPIFVEPS